MKTLRQRLVEAIDSVYKNRPRDGYVPKSRVMGSLNSVLSEYDQSAVQHVRKQVKEQVNKAYDTEKPADGYLPKEKLIRRIEEEIEY